MLCLWFHPLDSQLLAVAEGEAIISERAQHDGGVHYVLLKAQEPHIQSLKPHQHSILCSTSKNNKENKNIFLLFNRYSVRQLTLIMQQTEVKARFIGNHSADAVIFL